MRIILIVQVIAFFAIGLALGDAPDAMALVMGASFEELGRIETRKL